MSTESEPDGPAPGMVVCPVCVTDVPAGEYCGLCGVPLSEHGADGWVFLGSQEIEEYGHEIPNSILIRRNVHGLTDENRAVAVTCQIGGLQ